MGKQKREMHSESTQEYMVRSLHNRFGTLSDATMKQVGYFMALGDTEDDAKLKVDQISKEIFGGDSYVLGYIMGSTTCRTEFFNKINAIDEAVHPFMDQAAKDNLINNLTVT